jgi:hypothetical protein
MRSKENRQIQPGPAPATDHPSVGKIRATIYICQFVGGCLVTSPSELAPSFILHPGSLQNHDTFFTFLSRICQRSRLLDLFVFLHNVAENSFESVQDVIVGVLSHRDCGIMNWNFLLHELDHLGMP